jgi:ABC transporter substrate binding protein
MQARDAAVAAVFANPPVVHLPERQPIGEPAVVAFELKPGAVEVMLEQKIEGGGRRQRWGIARLDVETLVVLELATVPNRVRGIATRDRRLRVELCDKIAHAANLEDARRLISAQGLQQPVCEPPAHAGFQRHLSLAAVVHRDLIVTLAARHQLPAVYTGRYFVTAGGLISYGPDSIDPHRRAAGYVDRILKGENPADLPVQASTKYAMVINLKTAKALGLTIPPSVLARADEVIE